MTGPVWVKIGKWVKLTPDEFLTCKGISNNLEI